jgi:hypothetical protein
MSKQQNKVGRGRNPNSHHNKKKINGVGVVNKEVGLPPDQWELVGRIGEGNYSKGVREAVKRYVSLNAETPRELFAKLPLPGKAKLALELLLEGDERGRELGEAVLLELGDLENENLYTEALIEGEIQKPPQKAWIV